MPHCHNCIGDGKGGPCYACTEHPKPGTVGYALMTSDDGRVTIPHGPDMTLGRSREITTWPTFTLHERIIVVWQIAPGSPMSTQHAYRIESGPTFVREDDERFYLFDRQMQAAWRLGRMRLWRMR